MSQFGCTSALRRLDDTDGFEGSLDRMVMTQVCALRCQPLLSLTRGASQDSVRRSVVFASLRG
jgi:hypothetical protein